MGHECKTISGLTRLLCVATEMAAGALFRTPNAWVVICRSWQRLRRGLRSDANATDNAPAKQFTSNNRVPALVMRVRLNSRPE
jgi:hypothetical protein